MLGGSGWEWTVVSAGRKLRDVIASGESLLVPGCTDPTADCTGRTTAGKEGQDTSATPQLSDQR
jgi:hypothetical protein